MESAIVSIFTRIKITLNNNNFKHSHGHKILPLTFLICDKTMIFVCNHQFLIGNINIRDDKALFLGEN